MKGQIPVLEMIAVTIILFVSFSIFFPQTGFANRWSDAEVVLKGRDIMLTADRIGSMGSFSANPAAFANFLNITIPEKNLIYWSVLEGTLQSKVTVACNCTTQQINDLLNWIGRMRLNGRNIQIDMLPSTLTPIQNSDVLLIWGRTDLAPFKSEILNYLGSGNGVVGIADVDKKDLKDGSAYVEIFGIKECKDVLGGGSCGGGGDNELTFINPSDTSRLTFLPHKIFFHLPIRTVPAFGAIVPLENASMPPCNSFPVFEGTFSFRSTDAKYWICDISTVYFDTNENSLADRILKENDTFKIDGFDFKMSYIDLNRTFISIRPGFKFDDFRKGDGEDDDKGKNGKLKVFPADGDAGKILLKAGDYNSGNPIPVIVANGSASGRVMWGPDFITEQPVNHDERLLLASMLLSASNKKSREPAVGNLQIGFLTPYINVINRDMFEVYQFNLGLGFPF